VISYRVVLASAVLLIAVLLPAHAQFKGGRFRRNYEIRNPQTINA